MKAGVRLLRPGGLLLAEDTLFPVMELQGRGTHFVAPIQKSNEVVADSSVLESTIRPMGRINHSYKDELASVFYTILGTKL